MRIFYELYKFYGVLLTFSPNDQDNVEEFLPLSEQYTITDVRGWLGLTMKEFTHCVLIGGGIFLGAVMLLVVFFVIRSKRKAKNSTWVFYDMFHR